MLILVKNSVAWKKISKKYKNQILSIFSGFFHNFEDLKKKKIGNICDGALFAPNILNLLN